MKNRIFFATLLSAVVILLVAAQQPEMESGYYFFDDDDIQNIRSAAQTDWGQRILSQLEEQVSERRQHSLRVPLLEAGYGHHYFCPVHNIMFTFDWDEPYRHYCRLCDKHWENVNYYDWAWIWCLHQENLKYLAACMYLYIASGDRVYAEYIRDMMMDYALKYPTYFEHGQARDLNRVYGGLMFTQSLDEAVWATDVARAYMVAKPVMTADEIKYIEDGYLKRCAQLIMNRPGGGNWQAWHNSGLAALGIALQEDSIVTIALDDPKLGYHALMKRHVYDDGWWTEGSPTYHYYPLQAILWTADAVRCRNINLFDQKLHNMLASPALAVYADLTFPAHNDGWHGVSIIQQAFIYELGCRHFKDPFFVDLLKSAYKIKERTYLVALRNGMDISLGAEKLPLKTIIFEGLGVAVLRSDDRAVVFKYGPWGSGHGHLDKLSISLFNGKEELLPDLGTPAYGVPDFPLWYGRTVAHNTVVVDRTDHAPVDGQLLSFKPSNTGGSVEAKVIDAFPGVEMTRSLNLQNNRLADIFTCTSPDEHVYDYILLFTQKPQFTMKGEPVDIKGAPGYDRITQTEIRKAKRKINFRIDKAEINIQLLSGIDFEVITGLAPGIPPSVDWAGSADYVEKPVYPLLIRVKGKDMKIKTEWNLIK